MEKHIEMKMCNYKPWVSRGLFFSSAFLIGIPIGILLSICNCKDQLHSYTSSELSKIFYWERGSSQNILIGILIRIEYGSALSNVCRMGIKFFAGEVRVGTQAPI